MHLPFRSPAAPAGPRPRALAALLLLLTLGACGGDDDFPLRPQDPFQRDLARSEEVAAEVERETLLLLGRAFTATRSGARQEVLEAILAPEFRARVPREDAGRPWPDGTLELTEWSGASDGGPCEVLQGEPAFERLDQLLGPLRPGERAAVELHRFRLAPGEDAATGRCELHLGGPLGDGGGQGEVRLELDLALVPGPDRWRLTRLDLLGATRVLHRGPRFAERSGVRGLGQHEGQENRQLLQAGMDVHRTLALGGLSACDWDEDGFPDVIATRKGQKSLLFRNDGRGGFVPEPLPLESPLECPAMLLVVDLDGDGRDELVGSEPLRYVGSEAHLALWTRSGSADGSWRRVDGALRLPNPRGLRRLAVQTLVPCDVEGDGDLDLFVAVYGSARSRGEHYNTVEAHDGADNHLLVQTAPLVFSEESEARGIRGTQYTYVATAFDFDGDHDVDLLEGNDFGPNVLWRNDGHGHFVADEQLGFHGVPAYTMGATLGDPEAEGVWSLYLSNMSSEQGMRMVELPQDLSDPMRATVDQIANGNMLLRQGPDGWHDHARAAGVAEGEWAWGCAFCDLDNDGDQDLVVTNGFTTHSDPLRPDWQTYYWRQVLADARHLERGERSQDANPGLRFEGSFNGHERDRCFWNPDGAAPRAGRAFVEAGYALGLDADHDGRAVLPLDVDGDGDLDLLEWTLQGLRLYENPSPTRAFLRLELRRDGSRERALGAAVHATWGERRAVGLVRAVDGFQTQVPWEVHLGLGDLADAPAGPVHLEVRWPDGVLETWEVDPRVGPRFVLEHGDPTPRARPLPAWGAAGRWAVEGPLDARQLATRADGGRSSLGSVGLPTVVHLPLAGSAAPWEDRDWGAAAPAAWVLLEEPGREVHAGRERADVQRFVRTPELFPGLAVPSEVGHPVTLLFAADGSLARAFTRVLTAEELARWLAHLAPDPPYPDLLVEAGRRSLSGGRFREAQALFELALEGDPGRTDAWDGLARTHLRFGRDGLAEDAYARAVAADPDYALGHYNLGVARGLAGDLPGAVHHLGRATELDPDEPRAWLALAEAASALDPERAVDACEQAARRVDDAAPRTLQGKLLANLGRFVEAREALRDALARDPDDGEARAALEQLRAHHGD